MNKQEERELTGRKIWGVILVILNLIFIVVLTEVGKENKELEELLFFSINMTGYCSEQLNISFEDLADRFLRSEAEKIITRDRYVKEDIYIPIEDVNKGVYNPYVRDENGDFIKS